MKRLFVFLTLISSIPVTGQNKISFDTQDSILWAGVDRPGDLFLVFKSGEIQKFSSQGKLLAKTKLKDVPVLLDPGDGAQSFYYIRKENIYGSLSSELSLLSEKQLDPAFAVSPWLICRSSLHELWIFDTGDFSLKKTKFQATTISLEVPLTNVSKRNLDDFLYIREYQNLVFLLDKSVGIHLYSSLGKYIRTIGEGGINNFNFLGEELYYIKEDALILVDLYTEERRSRKLPQLCNMALVTDTKLFAIEQKRVSIYDFKP